MKAMKITDDDMREILDKGIVREGYMDYSHLSDTERLLLKKYLKQFEAEDNGSKEE